MCSVIIQLIYKNIITENLFQLYKARSYPLELNDIFVNNKIQFIVFFFDKNVFLMYFYDIAINHVYL